MTNYIISTENSIITQSTTAFASTSVNSTLKIKTGAELVSLDGGDGVDITDFSSLTVNGTIGGYSGGYFGIDALDASTANKLVLTIGATGQVYGGDDGIVTAEDVSINNLGAIYGQADAGIDELNSISGADNLINYSTGIIESNFTGFYAASTDNTKITVNQTLDNYGLISGTMGVGVLLAGEQDDTITNETGGQIIGGDDGISLGTDVRAQTVVNDGLIQGFDDSAIQISHSGGAVTITNSGGARILGSTGILEENSQSAFSLRNTGIISGSLGDGLLMTLDSLNTGSEFVKNAATGEITGSNDGLGFGSIVGAISIINAGTIVGSTGAALYFAATGVLNISNYAAGKITGFENGIDWLSTTHDITVTNSGGIVGIADDGIYLDGTTVDNLTNAAGGHILGGLYGIQDVSASGALNLSNQGVIRGFDDAIVATGGASVTFINSGTVKGNVILAGADKVKITDGKVVGNIDMSASNAAATFNATGGAITGNVFFGNGAGNVATIGAGVAGISFTLHSGNAKNTFVFLAANASTSKNLDTISHWQASGDLIDLSAFAQSSSFENINQTIASGNDFVTLAGAGFEVELVGQSSKIGSDEFKF
jgi:hypothetical protein